MHHHGHASAWVWYLPVSYRLVLLSTSANVKCFYRYAGSLLAKEEEAAIRGRFQERCGEEESGDGN